MPAIPITRVITHIDHIFIREEELQFTLDMIENSHPMDRNDVALEKAKEIIDRAHHTTANKKEVAKWIMTEWFNMHNFREVSHG